MKIAIHGKEFNRVVAPLIARIFEILVQQKATLYVSSKFSQYLKPPLPKEFIVYNPGEPLSDIQLFISIGGDGTLLESVTHIGRLEIPILGINTGRLGFLATISKEETEEALQKIFRRFIHA